MLGGRINVQSSMGSFPSVDWVSELDYQKGSVLKPFLSFKNRKSAYLHDVANEGYYCPGCKKLICVFETKP
jgi:hypothetical protein